MYHRLSISATYLHLLFCLLVLTGAAAWSAEITGRSSNRVEPMPPTSFDKATVQHFLDTIDEGRNASMLKVLYFMAHRPQALPIEEGYALAKAAAAQEQVGSKRWFYLQSVCAFAALDLGPDKREEGFTAYSAIFEHAAEAEKVDALYALQRSIYEYVGAMPSVNVLTEATLKPAVGVLLKAYTAQLALLKGNKPYEFEPNWDAAFVHTIADRRFGELTEKALADPKMPHTTAFVKLTATAMRYYDPFRAITLLQQAKGMVPRHDTEQLDQVYSMLIEQKWDLGQHKEAIATQQEAIQRLGYGRGNLARLYLRNHDLKAYEATVAELEQAALRADSDERDITEAATILLRLHHDDRATEERAHAQGAQILESYLKTPRQRDIETELGSRLALADYDLAQGKTAEAKAVLDVAGLRGKVQSADAGILFTAAQRMRRSLEGGSASGTATPAHASAPDANQQPSTVAPAVTEPMGH
jgi:hypothetical protein